jgi:hypothetical protein
MKQKPIVSGSVPLYADGAPVNLGDLVRFRRWLVWRTGHVAYVPGISPKHRDLEFRGLRHVGIQFDSGIFTALVVDPDSSKLPESLRLVARSAPAGDEVKPKEKFE